MEPGVEKHTCLRKVADRLRTMGIADLYDIDDIERAETFANYQLRGAEDDDTSQISQAGITLAENTPCLYCRLPLLSSSHSTFKHGEELSEEDEEGVEGLAPYLVQSINEKSSGAPGEGEAIVGSVEASVGSVGDDFSTWMRKEDIHHPGHPSSSHGVPTPGRRGITPLDVGSIESESSESLVAEGEENEDEGVATKTQRIDDELFEEKLSTEESYISSNYPIPPDNKAEMLKADMLFNRVGYLVSKEMRKESTNPEQMDKLLIMKKRLLASLLLVGRRPRRPSIHSIPLVTIREEESGDEEEAEGEMALGKDGRTSAPSNYSARASSHYSGIANHTSSAASRPSFGVTSRLSGASRRSMPPRASATSSRPSRISAVSSVSTALPQSRFSTHSSKIEESVMQGEEAGEEEDETIDYEAALQEILKDEKFLEMCCDNVRREERHRRRHEKEKAELSEEMAKASFRLDELLKEKESRESENESKFEEPGTSLSQHVNLSRSASTHEEEKKKKKKKCKRQYKKTSSPSIEDEEEELLDDDNEEEYVERAIPDAEPFIDWLQDTSPTDITSAAGQFKWNPDANSWIWIPHFSTCMKPTITEGTLFNDELDFNTISRFESWKTGDKYSLVTLQDVKDVALFTAMFDIPPRFIRIFHSTMVDRFLRSLMVYMQYFNQVWTALLRRKSLRQRKVWHPNAEQVAACWKADLDLLRLFAARDYQALFRRPGILQPGDRLFEMLFQFSLRVVQIGLFEKGNDLFHEELQRLMRPRHWGSLNMVSQLDPLDRQVIRSSFYVHGSPVAGTLLRELLRPQRHISFPIPPGVRTLDIGIKPLPKHREYIHPKLKLIEYALLMPEEDLPVANVRLGILGFERSMFNPLLGAGGMRDKFDEYQIHLEQADDIVSLEENRVQEPSELIPKQVLTDSQDLDLPIRQNQETAAILNVRRHFWSLRAKLISRLQD